MAIKSNNDKGNKWHDEVTGEFASKNDFHYANHLDEDVLTILDGNEMPEKYITEGDMKCSKSAAYNLLKAYNDDTTKDIKLCIGELQDPSLENKDMDFL